MKITIPLTAVYSSILILVISTFCYSKSYAQPANNTCATATSLTENAACTNLTGQTLKNATATTGVPGTCGSASSADVWYQFTATSSFPVITISSFGSSLQSAAPVIQLLSGTCGSLVSVSCVSGTSSSTSLTMTTALSVGGAGLTTGTTYYIRVYTATNTGTTAGSNWGFSICLADPSASVPTVDFGKSYVNVTKGTNGGTIEPGDILEVRATFVVKANTAYVCSFTDNIPANTTYVPGTLSILTNEGKVYKTFTDNALDADGGFITGSAVTINLGAGASSTSGGTVTNTSKPSFYNSACIMVASYRVTVNTAAVYGTKVPVGFGSIAYKNSAGTATTKTFPADTIMVYKNYGICTNTVGTNAILSESGGTFGSGSIKDRTPSSKVPANYTYAPFSNASGMPGDYYYGISNNTSGGTTTALGYTTLNTYPYPTNPQRIFGVWDIIGDHTGATNPLLGNPATDDNAGASGGYMVVINASYRTDTAFLDTITNLCPNTYYQYAAWFRNICSRCGCDSNGNGAGVHTPAYVPTGTGDSSGVHPNLTFNINGFDYYTTGDIQYTGQWIQKGFTYQTGPTQTSMVINIRNNAPGGGGNDWAIDDIGVATCSPTISLTPNKPDTLCQGADDTVRFKVSSYFSNYTEYKLEKSVDGGATWTSPGTDTTGAAATGSAIPVYNSTTNQYEYLATRYYRLSLVDTLTIYRITVASTVANLSNSSCALANTAHKLVLGVNCMHVLPVNILCKGDVNDGFAKLQWTSSEETGDLTYSIERSDDQVHFIQIGSVAGSTIPGIGATYHFTDPAVLTKSTYYRINMVSHNSNKFSNIVLLSNTDIDFEIRSLVNPFADRVAFDMSVPEDNTATFTLFDLYGRVVKQEKQPVTKGLNSIRMYNVSNLAEGTYTLQVQYMGKVINKRMIKLISR